MIRGKQIRTLAVLMAFVWAAQTAFAQDRAQTESRVSAELVKGRLNPATSKPGDEIAVRLQDDVKSNGQVVMKKGSTIKGVVKKVQRADNKSNAKANGAAQSMMELEWVAPGLSGAASQSLNLALQSVVYTNPLAAHQQEPSNEEFPARAPASSSSRSSSGGGLGAGVVGGVTGIVGGTASSVGAVAGAGTQGAASVAQPHAISAVSTETSSSLQNSFGMSGGPLFHVGSGQSISGSGSATSMDIFSHMSNDAVITSPSRDFEISSGAQMQLLVQGSAKK